MATTIATTPPPLPINADLARRNWRSRIAAGCNRLWGLVSLTGCLAILAAIPILNLLCLGYLLTAAGRVANSKRLRDGFPGIDKAARLGKIAFGGWLVTWPLRGASQLADAAYLIEPGGAVAARWQLAVTVILVLTVLHMLWACARGGRLRHFLWPAPRGFLRWLRTPGKYVGLRDPFCNYLASLRLQHYARLGFYGAVGTLAWLIPPISLLLIAARAPEGVAAILSFIGGICLIPAAIYLPWLQIHFAQTGHLRAFRELKVVRNWFNNRPFTVFCGTFVILGAAAPLFLLKVELAPREIQWLPAVFFVAFIWPARLLVGRLAAAAASRDQTAPRLWRWLWRGATLFIAIAYVLTVYLSQYLSWDGTASLLQQHAFLVPGPGWSN